MTETSSEKKNELKTLVLAALNTITSPKQAPDDEERSSLSSRFLDVQRGEFNWQIHVGSDGLDLEQKLAIEKQLLTSLGKSSPKDPFSVYFRRVKGNIEPTKSKQPYKPRIEPQSPINPFGLKINKKPIPGVRDIILIASGKGGVGKSTISTNLSIALSKLGHRVGFLDADVYGPSGPTMLGAKGPALIGPDGKLQPVVSHGIKVASFGFLSDAYTPVIWRGPLVSKAIEQLCFDVSWGAIDTLIVDLPPGTGDVQLSFAEKLAIRGAIIVSTPQDVALLDAHKALSMFNNLSIPVLGMVENMHVHICSNCGHRDHVFGDGGGREFSKMRQVPILASIPLDASIRMACDTGQPVGLQNSRPQAKVFAQLAHKLALVLTEPNLKH